MSVKIRFVAVSAFFASTLAAHAEPSRIQQFDDWGVYSYQSKGNTVCYALSVPKTMEPSGIDHGKNYFLLSPGGGKGGGFVPEAVAGYELRPGGTSINIAGRSFSMLSKGNSAWVQDEAQEPVLVNAMRGGSDMTVNAMSKRGTATRYTYSLSGITAALKKVSTCN